MDVRGRIAGLALVLLLSIFGTTVAVGVAAGYTEHDETMTVASDLGILVASDGFAGDGFGASVDVDGDLMVIGAFGAAYVFTRTEGLWVETAKLTVENSPPDRPIVPSSDEEVAGTPWEEGRAIRISGAGTVFGGFGRSVAVDGDVIVVGAYEAAYVFVPVEGEWVEVAKLTGTEDLSGLGDQPDGTHVIEGIVDPGFFDGGFGSSVAVDGDVIAIAANGLVGIKDSTGRDLFDPGDYPEAVYVFTRAGDLWSETAKLVRPGEIQSRNFGSDVAIADDAVVVASTEAVYVYKRSGNQWAETAELVPQRTYAEHSFGRSVAVSGEVIMVGASSTAYMFERSESGWTSEEVGPHDEPGESAFGWDVDIFEGVGVMVPVEATFPSGPHQMAFSLFDRPRRGWRFTYAAYLVERERIPQAVAMGEGIIAVGTHQYSYQDVGDQYQRLVHANPGVVHLYNLDVLHPVGDGVSDTEAQVSETPTAVPTPDVAPTPTPTGAPAPSSAVASPVLVDDDDSSDGGVNPVWAAVIIGELALVVLIVAYFLIRRRPRDDAGRYTT